MKTIALISGGKDSILSILLALRYGHEPVVVANVAPTCSEGTDHVNEIDSYLFQTVGHEVVESIALCLGLPFRRAYVCAGQSKVQDLHYTDERDDEDEVETLYRLLSAVRDEFPDVQGVTTGAILSHYQRHRVEDVCERLGLCSLAFLWKRSADEVLDMVSALRLRAILVKTASIGLSPRIHLGLPLEKVRTVLERSQQLYGTHSAGEGGEFETIVLDCPLFREQCLDIGSLQRVIVDDNDYSPTGHLRLQVTPRVKTDEERAADADLLRRLPSLTFPSDRMEHLPHIELLKQECVGHAGMTPTSAHIVCEDPAFFWGCVCDVYAIDAPETDSQMESVLIGALQRIIDDVSGREFDVFFLLVFSPSARFFPAFYEAFAKKFSKSRPPGCTIVEFAELTAFRFEVLSAPRNLSDRLTLHVRSRSCWGAPSLGPYSLSNMVTTGAERDRRVLVSGCIGLVPTTQCLATANDLLGLQATVVMSHKPRDQQFPDLSQFVDIAAKDELEAFIAEFAFMYANSVNGLTHFGVAPEVATHVTFLLKDMMFAPLLPLLWRWCTGGTTRLTLWENNQACETRGNQLVYRILHITQLPCGAAIEVILEQRQPHLPVEN